MKTARQVVKASEIINYTNSVTAEIAKTYVAHIETS